ncbi:clr-1 [Pristionchus pacificus]|uniref:protein-tyrosine-phosphatase n=1 Tax=Pristionchus pacificus TaxID=54126 RepID=A0A2A6B7R2_PRIPA|nr:clr-1 [Pristionchus pacificus]|eukprot:PDM61901.1 clr-1 [Pristionchus pacificus]
MLGPVAVSKTRRKEEGIRWTTAMILIACYALHTVECTSSSEMEERGGEGGEMMEEEVIGNGTWPMSADELGIPRCETNHDCVANGVCQKGKDGYGRCLCPGSCPSHIPLRCRQYDRYRKVENACLMMDENYTKRFTLHHPVCHAGSCACPPMFDPSSLPTRFNTEQKMLPIRCDRREMNVKILAHHSPSVFRGAELTLLCCTNMDPSRIVEFSAVQFIQNTTIVRETTSTPFDDMHKRNSLERLYPQWCWILRITNAQFADSGTYSCSLKMGRGEEVEDKITVVVKERRLGAILHPIRHHSSHRSSSIPTLSNLSASLSIPSSPLDSPPPDEETFHREKKNRPTAAPRSIQDFNVTTNTTFAELSWTRTDVDPPLVIDLRLVRRTDRDGKEVWTMKNATSPVVIQDLRPATPYTIFVSVVDGQSEPYKFSQNFQTKDARPHAPKPEDVRVQWEEGGGQFCEVEWRSPPVSNGRITKYYVRVEGSLRTIAPSLDEIPDGNGGAPLHFPPPKEDKCANYDTSENADKGVNPVEYPYDFFTCKYGPLKPNRNYSVSLWAENKAARSLRVNFTKSCMTDYAEPDQVDIPQTRDALNNTHFTLRFDKPPKETNGPISYLAYIAESYSDLPYETIIGDGQLSEGSTNCSLTYLDRFRDEDGPLRTGLKYTGFVVVRVDKIGRTEEPELFIRPSSSSNRSRRQASSSTTSEAVYGYSDYFKPVFLRTSEDSPSSIGTLIAVVVSFLLLIVAAVGASLTAHRFGLLSPCLKKGDGSPLSTGAIMMGIVQSGDRRSLLKPAYEPIPAESLPQEFIMKHRDSDYLFTQEFEALPGPKLPATASSRNISKNRYKDIVAFDETRVKLSKVNGVETNDYINANWIKSYGGRKRFIASQAPLDGTVQDFWRMIWEHDIRIVVMLSNLVERGRNQSAKYWPDELSTPHPQNVGGGFSILPCGQQYMADHCIRTFDLTYQGPPLTANGGAGSTRASPEATGSITSEYANVPSSRGSIGAVMDGRAGSLNEINHGETRRVYQYHFTAWNDYKAPECPTGLLRFLMKLRSLPEFEQYATIIHCSAGVGRTGTLIAIDSLIDQCQKEGKADVFGFVVGMRKQRNLMVQNTEQYVFIYRALAEHQMFGETDRSVDEFTKHWRELSRKRGELRDEFERLKNTLEVPPTHKFAEKNPDKNRFPAAVPYDNKRVILAPVIGGHADAQYINASTVKGHFYPYILAQDPLGDDTTYDFWRMIVDHNVATIVMLTPEEEFAADEKYWPPKSSTARFNTFTVENLREEQWRSHCRERTLSVHAGSDKPRAVVQFSLAGWKPGTERPTDTEAMMSVIGRVIERQSTLSDDAAPILLHSRNGSTECGVFCAISLLIERLKAEERVDVFQTVHGIRHTRPQTFATIEEYEFVYETIHATIRRPHIER